MRIKLFESFDTNQLNELISDVKDCFSDMRDDETLIDLIEQEESIILSFKLETNYQTTSFDEFFKSKKVEFKIVNEINQCIERLKRVHPDDFDIDIELNLGDFDYELYLTIQPGSPIQGEFYKKTKDGIKFDYSKLNQILKLPRNVQINLSTSGSYDHLSFEFENSEDVEKYKDSLIEDFMKLKINGVKISGDIEWSYSTRTGPEMAPYKIYKDYKTQYRSARGSGERTINSVEFGLTKDFDYSW